MALFAKKMHDPVPAVARVVDNDGLKFMPGQAVHCPLDLMVEAEGMPAYMVHVTVRPKTGKWPEINQLLPVIIDRSNPSRVEIVWDQIPSLLDKVQMRTARRFDAAQQAMADPSAPAAQSADGSPQDLLRRAVANPAAIAETMRAAAMDSAASPWGAPVAGAPVAPDPADPVDRIARLADLRDRGALTAAEFDVQKKRILGE